MGDGVDPIPLSDLARSRSTPDRLKLKWDAIGVRAVHLPTIILATACLIMVGFLLSYGRWMMFWWDEWSFIFDRPDPTPQALMAPFFDTFVAVPVLVYDGLLAVFGLRTYLPYQLVAWASHFAAAFLLYGIVSRRSGSVVGLAAGISIVFLGNGYEVLLQPFQIQYLFAIIGGLLAIDQLDRGRPAVAAIALLPAIASSGLGVIYAGMIVTWGMLRRDRMTVVATVPAIGAYAIWYLTWGRESEHMTGPGLSPLEIVYSVAHGMGATVAGVGGLMTIQYASAGVAIATVVLAGCAVLALRGYRPDPLAIAAIAALVAEQFLRAVFRGQYGADYGARSSYVYAGAFFIWICIGALVGKRMPNHRFVPLVLVLIIAPMIYGNMRQLLGVALELRGWRATQLAELRLIEAYRSDPRLLLVYPVDARDSFRPLEARPYLAAIDRFGRPSLEYDWQPYVDVGAVEAARQRLLPALP